MKKSNELAILITGADAPGAAGVIHCFKKFDNLKIIVADVNPNSYSKYIVKNFEVILPPNHINYIKHLYKLCKQKKIKVLLPLRTMELEVLAKNKNKFEKAGIKILISNLSALKIANNKAKLYQFLKNLKIQVPDFYRVNNVVEFEKAVYALGYPAKPVCFKPAISNGGRGFRIIDLNINKHHLLFNHKPTSVYISLPEVLSILKSKPFAELVVCEYLPGDEYSVDCLAKKGKLILALPRTRKKIVNGISVEGEFIQDKKMIAYCKTIIESLKLHGNIGIQIKKSAKNKNVILEINPRIQGAISTALGANINLPLLALKQELNLPITKDELTVKWGVKFSRYWSDLFYE